MEPKKSFLIVSLILFITGICGAAKAQPLYAGGSEPGVVYEYDGTSWEEVSQGLGNAVLCLCAYGGHLYAGTTSGTPETLGYPSGLGAESAVLKKQLLSLEGLNSTGGEVGKVWRYDGDPNWTLVGDNLDNQVCSLIVFRGDLYAGTAFTGTLYKYQGDPNNWTMVDCCDLDDFSGFRSLYVWGDTLYIGDIGYDCFGQYDGNNCSFDVCLGGSCIWDYELYDSNLYASAFQGRVHRSSDGTTWDTIRGIVDINDNSWELETFQGYLYVTTGPKLERYDGNDFNEVWAGDGNEIISMISTGDALVLGTGQEAGYGSVLPGIGRVYAYYGDGNDVNLISGPEDVNMGSGIQSLYAAIGLTKTDDINDCVISGNNITYRICYSANGHDGTNVEITDYLPPEVSYVSSEPYGIYDPCLNTVIWYIGTLEPNESNCVTLTVKVGCVRPNSTITNQCRMTSDCIDCIDDIYAIEYTLVCSNYPTLTKEDNVPDGNCVVPDTNITYDICYNANGYADTNVVITDHLPDGVYYVSSEPPGDYNEVSQTVTWYIDTLEPDEWDHIMLTVKTRCVTPNYTITNTCEMTGDCIDEIDDVYADEETPVCSNYPTIDMNDNVTDGNCIAPDANITYDIRYNANGYGDTNVIITDTLPPEVNYISSDPCGSYDSGPPRTVTWVIGTLGGDDSGCLELVVQVNTSAIPDTIITNQCRITGDCIGNIDDIYAVENTLICLAGSYIYEVMADSPALWLRFEDYPLVDSSGNDYWVSGAANIEKTKGSMGKAAYLNKNYIAAANQQTEPNLPTDYNDAYAFAPNDISFELWFKADADIDNLAAFFNQAETKEYQRVIDQRTAPAAGRYYDGKIRAMTYARPEDYADECWRYTEPDVWPTDGDWHHLVVTYDEHYGGDPAVLGVKMYLDTVLVIDDANSGGGVVGPEMDHIFIGNLGSRDIPYKFPYKGYIDEFAIYPDVLSQCRVAAHYAAWKPKDCQEFRNREMTWDIDRNKDCRIDFYDFAVFALDWLKCNDPQDPTCIPNWE